jgi:hypothetical protein
MAATKFTVLSDTTITVFVPVGATAGVISVTTSGGTLVDINGDGRPDLAVTNYVIGTTVSILMNTTPAGSATVTFAPKQTFTVGLDPFAIVAGDFNGDGRQDLAIANFGSATISVLRNTTPFNSSLASFAVQQIFAVGSSDFYLSAADFNDPWSGWQTLTSSTATSVAINSCGTVVATFPGYGVNQMAPTASSWISLSPSNGNLRSIDGNGHVYTTFAPNGTYTDQPLTKSWNEDTAATAALLSVADYPFDLSSPF